MKHKAAGTPSSQSGAYPRTRMRRNRRTDWSRRLVAENMLSADDFIWPIFIHDRDGAADIPSMPGVRRLSIDLAVRAIGEAADLGIPAVALFPALDPDLRSEDAREAVNPDTLVCRAVRAVKEAHPDVGVI